MRLKRPSPYLDNRDVKRGGSLKLHQDVVSSPIVQEDNDGTLRYIVDHQGLSAGDRSELVKGTWAPSIIHDQA